MRKVELVLLFTLCLSFFNPCWAEEDAIRFRVSVIQVKTKAEAEQVLKKLDAGADFSEMCKKFSIGPEKERGGDVGFFAPGELMEPLNSEALKSKVGQYSRAIKTDRGYFVLMKTEESASETIKSQRVAVSIGHPQDKDINEWTQKLKDENWQVRRRAVEALGETKDPRAVEPLIQALKDENSNVRSEAAIVLGRIRDPRAVEPLIQALKDEEWCVRKRAADSLGFIKDVRATEPLIRALRTDEDDGVRSRAAYALGVLRDARAAAPLIAALRDRDRDLRYEAVRSLGKIGTSGAVEGLIVALTDEDCFVRRRAAAEVVRLGASADVEVLIEPLISALSFALYESKRDSMERKLVEQVVKIGEPAIKPLISELSNPKFDPTLEFSYRRWQYNMAETLAKIDKPAVKSLVAALKDSNADVRMVAARALGKIGDRSAVDPLIAALDDSVSAVQRQAAAALGEIEDPRATEVLNKAFEERKFNVIAGAHKYFIRRGEPGSEPILAEALNKYGDSSMAIIYLNSGNKELYAVASKWARDHGYRVTGMPGIGRGLSWGSGR